MNSVVLNLEPVMHLNDEQFYQLCVANRDLNLEMNAAGELIIVPPVGGESGNQEADLITDLNNWNRQTKLGKVFSSSTIFILPNGAKRSPDAAWVQLIRWEALTTEQRKKFPPLVPDFAIELRKVRCGGHCVGRATPDLKQVSVGVPPVVAPFQESVQKPTAYNRFKPKCKNTSIMVCVWVG